MNARRTHRHKATRAWDPGDGKERKAGHRQTEARNSHTHGWLGKEKGKDELRANGTPQMAHTARERAAKGESRAGQKSTWRTHAVERRAGHEGTSAGNRDLHTRRAQHRAGVSSTKAKATDAAAQARKVDQDTNETRKGSAGAQLSAARATRGDRHQARKSNAAAREKCAREANADSKRTQAAHRKRRHKTRGSVGRRPWRQAWDGRKDSHRKNKAAEPQHQTKWHDETQCAPRVGNKKQKSKTQREEKPGIADARQTKQQENGARHKNTATQRNTGTNRAKHTLDEVTKLDRKDRDRDRDKEKGQGKGKGKGSGKWRATHAGRHNTEIEQTQADSKQKEEAHKGTG
ncbi:hypothetical protein, conserved in T. vivax [Trypanosoma vivax Y486]|uniref:Uncharacterized protein n=1 Tax=Trypanosoma vivax (strain Y486) TaxID=1055687 RepID=F9WW19_TRYVY|nr:hypothetical protein, conserved in T. vivax [Trypanosoma vivax Y486]|eukprot:CCD21786.1 hypothetical protein, conserved in T. vivax [Trypanosoma vivax Y486]